MSKVKAATLFLISATALLLTACISVDNGATGFSGDQNPVSAHGANEQDNQYISPIEPDVIDESGRMANERRSQTIIGKIHAQLPTDSWG
jgi:hypothetical protein